MFVPKVEELMTLNPARLMAFERGRVSDIRVVGTALYGAPPPAKPGVAQPSPAFQSCIRKRTPNKRITSRGGLGGEYLPSVWIQAPRPLRDVVVSMEATLVVPITWLEAS